MSEGSSPFQKKEYDTVFQREKTLFEKSWQSVKTYAGDLFLTFIPSDDIKQMPPYYVYLFGSALVAILIGIFVGLFVNGYQTM